MQDNVGADQGAGGDGEDGDDGSFGVGPGLHGLSVGGPSVPVQDEAAVPENAGSIRRVFTGERGCRGEAQDEDEQDMVHRKHRWTPAGKAKTASDSQNRHRRVWRRAYAAVRKRRDQ